MPARRIKRKKAETVDLHIHLPVALVRFIDSLIEKGFYVTRNDVIADAIRRMMSQGVR